MSDERRLVRGCAQLCALVATPTGAHLTIALAFVGIAGGAGMLTGCGQDQEIAGKTVSGADAGASDAACVGDACAPCEGKAIGSECDDGDLCTSDDQCGANGCEGVLTCGCTDDASCADQEDGDACNGTLYCDKTTPGAWACKVNPTTTVTCGDDEPCATATCDAKTGKCVTTPLKKGAPCDDELACTASACDGQGACKTGAKTCECLTQADCVAQDDGDACNGKLYCNKAVPKEDGLEAWRCETLPSSVVTCPKPSSPCHVMACKPASGVCVESASADNTACDDGDGCTKGDVCVAGACKPGTLVCKCTSSADCAGQDDGDKCNGLPYCDLSSGQCQTNPATVVTCPKLANNACATAQCQPSTGLCLVVGVNESGACDDGDPCTQGESCAKMVCGNGSKICNCSGDADCKPKEDGDLCNGTLYCNKTLGECEVNPATVVTCSTSGDNACRQNVCAAKTGTCGMKSEPDGQACSDGNGCTVGDSCVKGVCAAGPKMICPCAVNADCAKFEDGDQCNGTLYCDKSGGKATCALNPATVVSCKTVDDTACLKTSCAPKSGACVKVQSAPGAACDDGDPCSGPDGCAAGLCQGATVTCDDKDPCTVDACVSEQGGCQHAEKPCDDDQICTADSCDGETGACVHSGQPGPCDDGDACTTADLCAAGTCVGKGVSCNDGNACTTDSCEATTGCVHTKLSGGACSDGNACTTDTCKLGVCLGAQKPAGACDDKIVCTVDVCHALAGCLHLQADGLPCDDNNPCTGADACDGGNCLGLPGAASVCDDNNPCTADGCKASTGCSHVPTSGACDDGDPCTGEGQCKAGVCSAGKDAGCACKKTSDCKGLEDGNACNGTLICDTSEAPYSCKVDPATVVVCKTDASSCASATCAAKTGKCEVTKAADGAGCSPFGDPCLAGTCQSGQCINQGTKSCNDANACTLDVCAKGVGCVYESGKVDGKSCDDGDACTQSELCTKGVCGGGKEVDCDDKNPCTLTFCDAKVGCQSHSGLLDGKPCDDGDACTLSDVCAGKACVGGKAKSCDDGELCTTDACVAGKGCVFTNNGLSCDDNNPCTKTDVCKLGVCSGALVSCKDANPCTLDYCDPALGCSHATKAMDGKLCVHAASCVVGAFCSDGSCAGGDASACDNTGDCKLQSNSLFVTMGPSLGGVRNTAFEADGSSWNASFSNVPPTWLLVHHDDFGKVVLSKKFAMKTKATEFMAIHALKDGGLLLGGGVNAYSPQHWQNWRSWLMRVDKQGAVLWTNKIGQFNGTIRGIVRQSDGTLALNSRPDSGGRATFVVFTEAGKKIASSVVKGPKYTYYLDHYHTGRLIAEPAGGFYAPGRLGNPSYDKNSHGHMMIARFNSKAKRLWARYVPTGYQSSCGDVAITGSNELTGVGYRQFKPGSAYTPWMIRVTKSGGLLSSAALTTGPPVEYRILTRLLAQADGGLVMTSYHKVKKSDPGWTLELFRLDSGLKTVWRRAWRPQTSATGASVTAVDGGWRLTGTTSLSKNGASVTSSLLIRTDAWGNSPCESAGKCAGKSLKSCDDKDPCTFDLCEPKVGCTHAKVPGCS